MKYEKLDVSDDFALGCNHTYEIWDSTLDTQYTPSILKYTLFTKFW